MFKYFLISIVLVPLLVGVGAGKMPDSGRSRSALRVGWALYAVVWFGVLYYLRYRWS